MALIALTTILGALIVASPAAASPSKDYDENSIVLCTLEYGTYMTFWTYYYNVHLNAYYPFDVDMHTYEYYERVLAPESTGFFTCADNGRL